MWCGGFGSADWFHNYVQGLTFSVGDKRICIRSGQCGRASGPCGRRRGLLPVAASGPDARLLDRFRIRHAFDRGNGDVGHVVVSFCCQGRTG